MTPEAAFEVLRQVWEGDDIPPPESLLKGISLESASQKLEDWPYSILTNLAHAVFWQDVWLNRLKGLRREKVVKDWQEYPAQEFPAMRRRFLEGMEEAMGLASNKPFEHQMKSDVSAIQTLIAIGIHNAYHMGQINLMKRQLKSRGSRSAPTT